MQKTGQIERTVDREFADEEARYRQYVPPSLPHFPNSPNARRFEKETTALQKESKAYLESMRGASPHRTLRPPAEPGTQV